MTAALDTSLSARRETLRAQLAKQRQLIAHQLDLPREAGYPRSATMRLLKQGTVPAATMIGGVATLFGGMRMYRTITAVLAAVGTLRATSNKLR